MRSRKAVAATVLAATLAMTAGCSAHPTPAPSASSNDESAAAKPSASRTLTPTPQAFTVPASCLEVVSEQRQATFAAMGFTLLYGPGSASGQLLGRFPDAAEPGSIDCDWGNPDESSSIQINVGPVTAADRAEILESLGPDSTAPDPHTDVLYQDGVAAHISARADIVRQASWVTVEVLPGGPDALTLAKDILAEAEQVSHAQ